MHSHVINRWNKDAIKNNEIVDISDFAGSVQFLPLHGR